MKRLVDSIKNHEGFEPKPYIDVLVRRNPEAYDITYEEMQMIQKHLDTLKLTFGYGFTYLTQEESDAVLEIRLKSIIKELEKREPFINKLPLEKQEIIAEMAYQMGVGGVMGFKKMWAALKDGDYEEASDQMMDSRWAGQTYDRARMLSDRMKIA